MKINNISNTNIGNNRQSFNGLGEKSVEFMVKSSDKIAAAGLVATFIAQDGIGSIIPRILTGFTRNSDKTGKLNYRFAALEACREILTGPPVMLLPIVILGSVQKRIGATLKSPVSAIESFTNTLKGVFQKSKNDFSNASKIKSDFYATSWETTLKTTCGKDYKTNTGLIKKLTSLMTELESAPVKVKGQPDARTSKVITGEIAELVSKELKSHADVANSFAKVAYKDGLGKTATASVGAFAGHMQNFAKDMFGKIGEVKPKSFDKLIETVNNTANKRIGTRVATNFLTLGAVLLYSIVVPKLYKKINKTNPGLIGLTDDDKKPTVTSNPKPVDYQAFEKLKDNENNKVAFKGLGIEKIAKAVQKDGGIRKFANAYEFNGINMSFATLMSFMGLGILAPRVANAYDKHDKREILTRDIFTIAALVFGSKALLKNIATSFEKKTGIVLSEKPENYFEKSKTKQMLDKLHPFSGVQVFSNNDISLKYTNVDKFKGGLKGFCDFITKSGGDLKKFFANDAVTKQNMEKMLKKGLDKASNEEIIKAVSNKKNQKFVKNIVEVFKNENNTFVKRSKSIIGVFDFVATFIAIPAFMIFLQKFNEKMTKRAIANEQAQKKAVEQKFTAVKLKSDLISPDASKLNYK